jgi:hypothetical protein
MPKKQANKAFAIVEFLDVGERCGSMEVIPSCWLHKNKDNSAWWPPKNIKSRLKIADMVRKQAAPIEATWQLLKIRVLGQAGEVKRKITPVLKVGKLYCIA